MNTLDERMAEARAFRRRNRRVVWFVAWTILLPLAEFGVLLLVGVQPVTAAGILLVQGVVMTAFVHGVFPAAVVVRGWFGR